PETREGKGIFGLGKSAFLQTEHRDVIWRREVFLGKAGACCAAGVRSKPYFKNALPMKNLFALRNCARTSACNFSCVQARQLLKSVSRRRPYKIFEYFLHTNLF